MSLKSNPRRPQQDLTLADVAAMAGVSTATVARVLNNSPLVSQQTRENVSSILASTGYRPNALARSLRTQRTNTLGHLLSRLTFSSHFAQISRDLEEEAFKHGYSVLIANIEGQASREKAFVQALIDRRVDAMIFTHAVDTDNVRRAVAAGIPIVQTERVVDCETHAILIDHTVGSREAVSHLVGLGHRRIAYLGVHPDYRQQFGPRPVSFATERYDAYRHVLAQANIADNEAQVRFAPYPGPPLYGEHEQIHAPAYGSMLELLRQPKRPTAVFVATGPFVMGALQAIYDCDLRIPHDISVIAYDDSIAGFLSPPLTSVALPTREMGQAACSLALQAIDKELPPQSVLLETKLRIRASTGAPPKKKQ